MLAPSMRYGIRRRDRGCIRAERDVRDADLFGAVESIARRLQTFEGKRVVRRREIRALDERPRRGVDAECDPLGELRTRMNEAMRNPSGGSPRYVARSLAKLPAADSSAASQTGRGGSSAGFPSSAKSSAL